MSSNCHYIYIGQAALLSNVSTIHPFKQKHRVGKEKVWEKISFGYNTSLQNKINFYAKKFNTPGFYIKFKNGYRENIYNDNHPEVYMIALLIGKRPRRSPTCSEASRQR